MKINVEPVAYVRGGRTEPTDDFWGEVEADIVIDQAQFSAEALLGLQDFSHVVVVFFFHKVKPEEVEPGARHPRGNTEWPLLGIFAQRAKNRPNRIGVSVCEILTVEGCKIRVKGLDAIDGTPVLDLKPYVAGFGPRGNVHEPAWVSDMMTHYWQP